jgi:hypothetical protein
MPWLNTNCYCTHDTLLPQSHCMMAAAQCTAHGVMRQSLYQFIMYYLTGVLAVLLQERVMATEAVHRMQHLEQLKRRLQQSDRCAAALAAWPQRIPCVTLMLQCLCPVICCQLCSAIKPCHMIMSARCSVCSCCHSNKHTLFLQLIVCVLHGC